MAELGIGLETLRQFDPKRYLCCLYLDEKLRKDVALLYAFDAEIARIPTLVSEPMPGEIRLQWWRDLIASGNNAGSGPLANSLMELIIRHDLPRETFHAYLDARIFDLYHDPMPDTGTFEGYLGETISLILRNICRCAGAEHSELLANACGHAGMAIGIARLLERCGADRALQKVYFPLDMLADVGLEREGWLREEVDGRHEMMMEKLCSMGRHHLTFARTLIGQLEPKIRSIFLELTLAEPVLKSSVTSRFAMLTGQRKPRILASHWRLFIGSLRAVP